MAHYFCHICLFDFFHVIKDSSYAFRNVYSPTWAPQCLTLLVMIIYFIFNTIVPKVRNQIFIFIKQSYMFLLRIWNSKSLLTYHLTYLCVLFHRGLNCLVLWVKFKRHWSCLVMKSINLVSWIRSNKEVRRKEIETTMPCWEIKEQIFQYGIATFMKSCALKSLWFGLRWFQEKKDIWL